VVEVEPHRPRRFRDACRDGDAAAIEQLLTADVVVLLGRGFQPSVEDAARQRQKGTVEVLRALPITQQGDVAGEGGQPGQRQGLDPHVWLDPRRFSLIVGRIGDALHRPQAAARLVARLRALDGVTAVTVEEQEQRQLLIVQTTGERELTAPLLAQLDGIEVGRVASREPTLEDAYISLVTAA
jgi:hypothetical protein